MHAARPRKSSRWLPLALVSIAGFTAGVGLALWTAPPLVDDPVGDADAPQGVQWPQPGLAPQEVVKLQVRALRGFRDDPRALAQCYVLASPSNRAVTGPLPRFAAMVRSPQYRALTTYASALVGRAVVQDDRATVLVTALDEDGRAGVFRFFLSRQGDDEFRDCWMTDAVTPDAGAPPAEDTPPTEDAAQRRTVAQRTATPNMLDPRAGELSPRL